MAERLIAAIGLRSADRADLYVRRRDAASRYELRNDADLVARARRLDETVARTVVGVLCRALDADRHMVVRRIRKEEDRHAEPELAEQHVREIALVLADTRLLIERLIRIEDLFRLPVAAGAPPIRLPLVIRYRLHERDDQLGQAVIRELLLLRERPERLRQPLHRIIARSRRHEHRVACLVELELGPAVIRYAGRQRRIIPIVRSIERLADTELAAAILP